MLDCNSRIKTKMNYFLCGFQCLFQLQTYSPGLSCLMWAGALLVDFEPVPFAIVPLSCRVVSLCAAVGLYLYWKSVKSFDSVQLIQQWFEFGAAEYGFAAPALDARSMITLQVLFSLSLFADLVYWCWRYLYRHNIIIVFNLHVMQSWDIYIVINGCNNSFTFAFLLYARLRKMPQFQMSAEISRLLDNCAAYWAWCWLLGLWTGFGFWMEKRIFNIT